jgi:hypothetical protein
MFDENPRGKQKKSKKVNSPIASGAGIIQSISVPQLTSVQDTFANNRSKKTSEQCSVASSTKGAKSRNFEQN